MTKLALAVLALALVQDDPIKEFEKRIKIAEEKVAGKAFQRATLDGKVLFRDFGKAPEFKVVEDDLGRFLKAVRDGEELLRVQLGDLGAKAELPPVVVDDAEKVSLESKARNVNGVSSCEVTINGKIVYKGPGSKVESKVSSSSESKDGKKTTRQYAEVYVDGKLVYKAGEAIPDPDPKRNKEDRYQGV